MKYLTRKGNQLVLALTKELLPSSTDCRFKTETGKNQQLTKTGGLYEEVLNPTY